MRIVLALVAAALGASSDASAITPVTPLGIPICDAFLGAYARCANSGGPADVRPGLRRAVGATREGSCASAAASERARRIVEVQCAQSHGLIRERLVQTYRCDLPELSAEVKALAAQGRHRGRPHAAKSRRDGPRTADPKPGLYDLAAR